MVYGPFPYRWFGRASLPLPRLRVEGFYSSRALLRVDPLTFPLVRLLDHPLSRLR